MADHIGPPKAPEEALAPVKAPKALLAIVIGLGILLVLGFALVAGTIAVRLSGGADGAAVEAPAALSLGPGQRIAASTVEGDRLVVTLDGPGGQELLIVDLETGGIVATLSAGGGP